MWSAWCVSIESETSNTQSTTTYIRGTQAITGVLPLSKVNMKVSGTCEQQSYKSRLEEKTYKAKRELCKAARPKTTSNCSRTSFRKAT